MLTVVGWCLLAAWIASQTGVVSAVVRSQNLRNAGGRNAGHWNAGGRNAGHRNGAARLEPDSSRRAPKISVLVPARNEAPEIGAALESLIAQRNVPFEAIVIDDRSEDGTGEVARQKAAGDPRVRFIRIDSLPPDWLGKTHALARGVEDASGEWLLFTDADVRFHPDALSVALHWAETHELDHLVLLPSSLATSFGEHLLMVYFEYLFFNATGFGWVRLPWLTSAYVGIGAFNLVRRSAYEAIGGHESLRLQVVDDVQLGKRIKAYGFRQDALHGRRYVSVYWQRGIEGIVGGLEKNAFAVTGYSVLRTAFGALAQLGVSVVPLAMTICLIVQGRLASALPWGVWSVFTVALLGAVAWANGYRPVVALFHPVAAVLFSHTLFRSMFAAHRRGGVVWRDSHYPLDQLRDEHF
ncbi:MAG: glycosyltransferase [Candidatus Eisenbacteria bacterium]|nr:glycosyltransferase [Candidatus Eisenbacteria bacterium]